MNDLVVVRLPQNPLGQEAPVGHRGDIVRVSDGRAALYLFPWEFETTDEARLRWLLAQQPSPAKSGDGTDSTESTDVRRLDGAELRARLWSRLDKEWVRTTTSSGPTRPRNGASTARVSSGEARSRLHSIPDRGHRRRCTATTTDWRVLFCSSA
jgi:hypothetical protein